MFGLFKKPPVQDTLLSWLGEVDKAYADAVHSRNLSVVGGYLSRDCFNRMLTEVGTGTELYSGIERYKHVMFKELNRSEELIKLLKTVSYDHIQISKGVRVPVGQDYEEIWEVRLKPRREVVRIGRYDEQGTK